MKYACIPTMLASLLVCSAAAALDVEVWRTQGSGNGDRLAQLPSQAFSYGQGTQSVKIHVDPTTTYQTIDGFGASLTDSSAWLMDSKLSSGERTQLLESLFSQESGIGLSMLRLPMGASDFALAEYTYDDTPGNAPDLDLDLFSIGYDQAYIIPTLQQMQTINPQLKIIASPWSPPAWMKTPQTLRGGSLRSQYYGVYADYFVRFVQAYAQFGIDIYAVTPQNEPGNNSTGLPSAAMTTFQQSAFIGDHLGPAFVAADLDTRIFCYDHNWDEWNYPVVVMNDAEAGQYTAGSAFHGYAGDVANQSLVHDLLPDREIHFTEISGGGWSTGFGNNLVWMTRNIIIGTTRNWSKSAIFWNIALDENSGPYLPGGCSNCRGVVTIDSNNGSITPNVEFYGLAHASKFVRPGAARIASDSIDDELETVAFRNPDGSEVLIALNPDFSSQSFNIVRNNQHITHTLSGRSVATFIWQPEQAGDFNGDGSVTAADIDDGTQGNGNSLFDFLGQPAPSPLHDLVPDGDSAGIIDEQDLQHLVEVILGSRLGDLDEDSIVSLADYDLLADHLGQAGGYFDGDLNGSLTVDLVDVAIFQTRFQGMPQAGPNLLINPDFDDLNTDGQLGDGWGNWGDTDFNDYFGGDPHASFYSDQQGHFGGVYQTGIAAGAGESFQFTLEGVRIELNADADFEFGLEFFAADGATKIGDFLLPIPLSPSGDGLSFAVSATAPTGTAFVRPLVRFDNVRSTQTAQENVFVFRASLRRPVLP